MKILKNWRDYDCIGWVPSVKGSLSLSLVSDTGPNFGHVDKYSFSFKTYLPDSNYSNFSTRRYVAATSLQTTIDSKLASNYHGTFRYVFHGRIDSNPTKDSNGKEKQKGILYGKLYIGLVKDGKFSSAESCILKKFSDIKEKITDYNNAFDIKAESMTSLRDKREKICNLFEELDTLIKEYVCLFNDKNQIKIEKYCTDKKTESEHLNNKDWDEICPGLHPFFCFDVALSRDGILLLKNSSSEECNMLFAAPGTDDDYGINIPVHRIFKMAMNFIKYLFHNNYHHNETHDNFLPASNLHPIKELDEKEGWRLVFKHQLDSFLIHVATSKRNQFKHHYVDCNGVLIYAKSFVNVARNHGIITTDDAGRYLEFISNQQEEYLHMNNDDRNTIASFILHDNLFFRLSAISASVMVFLNIIEFWNVLPERDVYLRIIVSLIVLFVTIFCYLKTKTNIEFKQFKRSKIKENLFWRNSNYESDELSEWYKKWIKYKTFRKKYEEKIELLKIIISLVIITSILIGVFLYFEELWDLFRNCK